MVSSVGKEVRIWVAMYSLLEESWYWVDGVVLTNLLEEYFCEYLHPFRISLPMIVLLRVLLRELIQSIRLLNYFNSSLKLSIYF